MGGTAIEIITAAGILLSDAPRAYRILDKMSSERCIEVLRNAGGNLSPGQTLPFAKWAATSPDVEKRRRLVRKALWFSKLAVTNADNFLEKVVPHLRDLTLSEDDFTWVTIRLALDSCSDIGFDLAKMPKEQIAWVERMVPQSHLAYAQGAMGHSVQPKQALGFLNAKLDEAHSDDLIAGYVESEDLKRHRDVISTPSGGNHGDTAFRLATRIQDSERRVALLVRAWRDLNKDDPKAAKQILEIPELTAHDRAAVEAQVAPTEGGKR